ncbi:MAG: TerC family protein [Pseudomonadota bacterium]
MDLFEQLTKLVQIIFIDIVLAGDNAIVVGMVAAKFTKDYRRRVILWGVGAAVVLRILFALLTVQLLAIKGLLLVGGLLLLWVCWNLWRELRQPPVDFKLEDEDGNQDVQKNPPMLNAIGQILVADVSMSLDNVLAVAGVAEGHTGILVIGLALAVAFMTFAATIIAEILQKHRWIGYLGLVAILYVAVKMTYSGTLELL